MLSRQGNISPEIQKNTFTESLQEKGFRPINLVVLHESNIVITPKNSKEDYGWWKAEIDEGKKVTIPGDAIEDLANFFKIKHEDFYSGPRGGTLKTLREFCFQVKVELGNGNAIGRDVVELWGKISQENLLSLVAFLDDEEKPEPRFSTHNEKFTVLWMYCAIEDISL